MTKEKIKELEKEKDDLECKIACLSKEILDFENKLKNILERDELDFMILQYQSMNDYKKALAIRINRAKAIDAVGGENMLIYGKE